MKFTPRKLAKSAWFQARRARVRVLALPRALPWLRRALHLPTNRAYDPLTTATCERVLLVPLDLPTTFLRPLPELPFDSAALPFFTARATEHCSASYVLELRDGRLWGHEAGAVFTARGDFISALSHDPCGAHLHSVWTRLHLPTPLHWPGRTLYLVTPEATDNFHHWLIDLLPRLGLVRRAGFDLASFDRVVVNHHDRGFQRDSLRALGIPMEKVVRLSPALHVRCDTLVAPSLKHHNQCAPAADLAFLRDSFLSSRSDSGGARRRLFLSRADARVRRLVNERELYPVLQTHGFEIVSLAGKTLQEQAQLFASAEIVVGPAGAAFANLVYCSPPTQVLEIASPRWLATYHWMISARRGLRHTIVLGEGEVRPGLPDIAARSRDLAIDPEKFAAALTGVVAAAGGAFAEARS